VGLVSQVVPFLLLMVELDHMQSWSALEEKRKCVFEGVRQCGRTSGLLIASFLRGWSILQHKLAFSSVEKRKDCLLRTASKA
jgi:hypothetical protein